MSHTHVQNPAQNSVRSSAQGHVHTPVQTAVQSSIQAPARPRTPDESHARVPDQPPHPRTRPEESLRGRIGTGFSPVPHRYRIYLADDDCPSCLGVASALASFGLCGSVALTVLPPGSRGSAAHDELRRAYEASGHHHDGALTVPALCDGWSGRVVSNHTPDILEDLRRLGTDPAFRTAG